jgi:hypothetical protein
MEFMNTGQVKDLSAKHLVKILGVTDKTIDMYLCGYGFSHIETVKRGTEKIYKNVTEKDLIALHKLANRKKRRFTN